MKIKNFKKKFIIVCFMLLFLGGTISFIGFSLVDFNIKKLEETGNHKWYRTFQVENSTSSYGIKDGEDLSIITIDCHY